MADSHLAASGGGCDSVRPAEGRRLNRHGRLSAPGGHQATSVAEEKVGNIVGAAVRARQLQQCDCAKLAQFTFHYRPQSLSFVGH